MQCKYHPSEKAKYLCTGCGTPLCSDCAEEAKPGQYYCFQCAMMSSVSAVGTSIKDRKEKVAEGKAKVKKKLTPFHYFVIVSAVLIVAMWGFILFGGKEPPSGAVDFAKNKRVFLFLVDSALKRYAHYEGNNYPERLIDLVPKYLTLGKEQAAQLVGLSYHRDADVGYLLSVANPNPGEMNIIISPKGIQYQLPSGEGA